MGLRDALMRLTPTLQWGHGREAMDGPAPSGPPRTSTCFNGAMAVRPWMA